MKVVNTGDSLDSYQLNVINTSPGVSGFGVRYFQGSTEITDAVVAGAFVTPQLAPGQSYRFQARVRVNESAITDSKARRTVVFTSVADSGHQDAVRFVVRAT